MDNNSDTKLEPPNVSIHVKRHHSSELGGASNVHEFERLASLVGGAILLFSLGRRFWGVLMMGFFGALLLYRGATGHCMLYSALGIDTSTQGKSMSPLSRETPLERELRHERQRDKIDERIWQSFPASDP
jgi:uncharacterized membrane protein